MEDVVPPNQKKTTIQIKHKYKISDVKDYRKFS